MPELEVIDVIASNLTTAPLPETEQGRLAEASEVPRASPRTYGILVVDDDECVRRVVGIGMRQQGFAVWVAASGEEALDLYRRHRPAIDLILMDVRMPGLDGPQTLAALQELNPQVRCCFMSGDPGSYTEGRLRGLGGAAFLQKPFPLAEVARMLWELAGIPIEKRSSE